MKMLAASVLATLGLAAPAAIACPGHDAETPKTAEKAEKDQAPKTADKAKPADAKKVEATKKADPKKPEKVSRR
jgi:hypothetical protein